ncbi:hypothetical protein BDY19DRAFT_562621 [Irpex rosettiformis]|uniref:Uncharacterized protein n=1 Tax=Irpex rosettiformis TaxID=378272 RepID=A0ACB8TQ04_9APHY|nr:hypothetical protein BDY19DRAFT_562621 [Irpex rosettiformis]
MSPPLICTPSYISAMRPPWLLIGAGAAFPSLFHNVAAQSFPVPSTWRKPTSDLVRADRLRLVDGLLSTIPPMYNAASGQFNELFLPQTGSLLCALSIGDRINGSTTNQDMVLKSLNTVFSTAPTIITLPGSGFNSDAVMWGLAAINSYRTYKDTQSLKYATSMWEQLNPYVVTPENAAAGKHPLRNVTISSTCPGGSTAGSVFYEANNAANTDVNAETTAGFMTLSALLHELTQNTTFFSAAELSASFVLGPLSTGNVIKDTITLQNCNPSTTSLTYNSGHAIHGLSVLGAANDSYASAASKLVSTVIPNTEWTDQSTGIINEGNTDISNNFFTQSVKTIYIRGLYEGYTRIPPGSPEVVLIRSHILVQYNALQDMASTPGGNQYSPQFPGPAPTQLVPWGQLAAADTLYSALDLFDNSSASGSAFLSATPFASGSGSGSVSFPPNTAVPVAPSTPHHISPAVIGGVIAGVILLLLALVVVFIVVRRRRRRYADLGSLESPDQQTTAVRGQMEEIPADMKYTYRPSVDDVRQDDNSVRSSVLPLPPTPGSSETGPPDYVTNEEQGSEVSDAENPFSDVHSSSASSVGRDQHRVDLTSLQGLVQHINRLMESEQNAGRHPAEPPPDYDQLSLNSRSR